QLGDQLLAELAAGVEVAPRVTGVRGELSGLCDSLLAEVAPGERLLSGGGAEWRRTDAPQPGARPRAAPALEGDAPPERSARAVAELLKRGACAVGRGREPRLEQHLVGRQRGRKRATEEVGSCNRASAGRAEHLELGLVGRTENRQLGGRVRVRDASTGRPA